MKKIEQPNHDAYVIKLFLRIYSKEHKTNQEDVTKISTLDPKSIKRAIDRFFFDDEYQWNAMHDFANRIESKI